MADAKTIMVTGGAGYIGSHMTKLLDAAGHKVIIYDNLSRGNRHSALYGELVVGDIHDSSTLSHVFATHKVDAVMHFAALAYVGESVDEPETYYHNNVVGTLNLLNTMRRHDINQFVFSSTCATYGEPETMPITEDLPQTPINPYGQSKLMVEKILQDYGVAYGLRSIALRYFNAAGCAPDGTLGEEHDPETHLIPVILLEALRVRDGGDRKDTKLSIFGDDFPTPDGTCVRDYIHVDDLCSAHLKALERIAGPANMRAEQFNLGTNRGVSVLEVIEACSRVTGIDIPYQKGPRRAGDPPELVSDASLAMNTLDWQPQYLNIDDSISHAWNWFQAVAERELKKQA
ncbi:MAG: UDP-glucose 4-epimerase GalE [Gammaproteobacteria bacterium]|nr:UDP-glucose 4-epimerase GalE [Gammaproteobacteria bacterium]